MVSAEEISLVYKEGLSKCILDSPSWILQIKNCAILCCRHLPKWKRRRWLLQSYLMAHANIRLELLHSCPDTVHGITLHKTLRSTFLTARKPSINSVEKGIQLCYSGLQIQGAATSPPTRSLYIIHYFFMICNRFYLIFPLVWQKSMEDFVKNS